MKHSSYYHQKHKLQRCVSWTIMEECLPPDIVEEYREAFKMLDRKKVGKISVRDVSTMVCSIGICLTEADLIRFVSQVVEVKNFNLTENYISFPQFLATMTSIITNCVPEEEANRIFQEFDKDGDGYISANELRNLLYRLGDDVTDDEIQEMMDEADTDGDGMVSLQEFINVMNSAHSTNNDETHIYSLPRILTYNEEDILSFSNQHKSADFVSTDPEEEEEADDVINELNQSTCITPSHENQEFLSSKIKANTKKRKKSIIDWIRGTQKEVIPLKLSESEPIIEVISSSCCSVGSEVASSIPSHMRERRKSSIAKTLRYGKDALIAKARIIRKLSG